MLYRLNLSDRQHTLLANMAVLAKDRYIETAKELRESAEAMRRLEATGAGQHAFITSTGYDRLAEQFEDQAQRAAELIEMIDEAEEV